MDDVVIEKLATDKLTAKRDAAEAAGDWPLTERCEAELGRRDYDASDPASPENTHQDTPTLDPPWWEYR
jgi:hypothetical protein